MVIVRASQQAVTHASKFNAGVRVTQAAFTISGNTITFSEMYFAQFQSHELGNSLMYNAGDVANINEIWGL